MTEIPVNEDDEESSANTYVQSVMPKAGARMSFTAPASALAENAKEGEDVDPMESHRASRVSDRDDEYKARRRQRIISPERHDPFAAGDQTPAAGVRTYGDIMAEQQLKKEREAVMQQVAKKMEEEKEQKKRGAPGAAEAGGERKRRRLGCSGRILSLQTALQRAQLCQGACHQSRLVLLPCYYLYTLSQ